jgi:hypothetical protein
MPTGVEFPPQADKNAQPHTKSAAAIELHILFPISFTLFAEFAARWNDSIVLSVLVSRDISIRSLILP